MLSKWLCHFGAVTASLPMWADLLGRPPNNSGNSQTRPTEFWRQGTYAVPYPTSWFGRRVTIRRTNCPIRLQRVAVNLPSRRGQVGQVTRRFAAESSYFFSDEL